MISLNIVSQVDPPFSNPLGNGTFFCNKCKNYSNDFSLRSIETHYRRCKSCHNLAMRDLQSKKSIEERLLAKLKQNLKYQNKKDLAKATTLNHVNEILVAHGLMDQEARSTVKTIKANFDPVKEQWFFSVIFK